MGEKFYLTFEAFQDYYANKFQRHNPLPWQDGMQAIIWWITEGIPANTQASVTITDNPTGVEISGVGTEEFPYTWVFNFKASDVKGPKGDTGAQGPQGPKGDTGEQGPAGQDGTIVVANPEGAASGDLTKIGIGGVNYNVGGGGGGGGVTIYQHLVCANDSYFFIYESPSATPVALDTWGGLYFTGVSAPQFQIPHCSFPNVNDTWYALCSTTGRGAPEYIVDMFTGTKIAITSITDTVTVR